MFPGGNRVSVFQQVAKSISRHRGLPLIGGSARRARAAAPRRPPPGAREAQAPRPALAQADSRGLAPSRGGLSPPSKVGAFTSQRLALPSPAGGTRARPPSPRRRAEGDRNAAPWGTRRRWPTWRRGRARRGAATTCASRTSGCRCVRQPLSLGRHRVRCTPRVKLKLHTHNIYRVYHRVATSKVKSKSLWRSGGRPQSMAHWALRARDPLFHAETGC